MFGFWKNKSIHATLELLVEKFDQFMAEQRAQKDVPIVQEEGSNARITVHYHPGKELFVYLDGDKISSGITTKAQFEKLSKLAKEKNVDAIKSLLIPDDSNLPVDEAAEEKVIKTLVEEVHYLASTGDFEVVGDSIRLVGIKRSIPKILVDDFVKFHIEDRVEEYEALKNFWRWIVTNPNAQATESFYNLMKRYPYVRITKEGFVLSYRWVKTVEGKKKSSDSKLIEFVTQHWVRLKKAKKGTKNYNVIQYQNNQEYILIKGNPDDGDKLIGNLHDLYINMHEVVQEQVFTDNHSQTMDIRIGREVSMNRDECDESNLSCSYGLHSAFCLADHMGLGDTKIVIAICPRDIINVPSYGSKFRCCKYLPIAILGPDEDEKNFALNSSETLDLLEHHLEFKVDELKKEAEENTVEELTEQRLLPERPDLEEEEVIELVENIVDQFSFDISKRVKKIE